MTQITKYQIKVSPRETLISFHEEYSETKNKNRLHLIGALMALGLSGALMTGCVGAVPEDSKAEAHEDLSEQVETLAIDDFTTKGKPTKTVGTPWGSQEIYDPVQDPDLIATQFKRADLIELAYAEKIKSYVNMGCENYLLSNCNFCVMKTISRRVVNSGERNFSTKLETVSTCLWDQNRVSEQGCEINRKIINDSLPENKFEIECLKWKKEN